MTWRTINTRALIMISVTVLARGDSPVWHKSESDMFPGHHDTESSA
ncbi:MAG: hypothetical protein ABI894_16505 [Ilumatobacteraceae bacterium]